MPNSILVSLHLVLHLTGAFDVPSAIVQTAQRETIDVFRRAGILAEWAADDRADAIPITIWSRESPAMRVFSPRVLGAVVGGGDGREGAWVFFRRVQTSSDRLGLDAAIVLGDAVAHEIGHLLLPRGTHSASGLMRAAWTDEDLLLAVRGQLGFTETEARVIKDAILLRPSSLVPGPSVVPGSASSPGLTVQVSAIAAPRRAEN